MIKRLYNKSGNTLEIFGRDVADNDFYDVPRNRFLELADDIYEENSICQLIESSDIWVNNGSEFIVNVTEAKRYCEDLSGIRIKKDDGTISETTRSINLTGNVAINKVGDQMNVNIGGISNIGFLYCMSFVKNGSAQNKFSDSIACNIPSDYSPQPCPFNMELIGITFTNNKAGSDFDIEVWKSDRNDGPNEYKVTEWQVRNGRIGYKTNITGKNFNAGDKVAIFIDDEGMNPNDMGTVLIFKILNDNNKEEFVEDFEGHF